MNGPQVPELPKFSDQDDVGHDPEFGLERARRWPLEPGTPRAQCHESLLLLCLFLRKHDLAKLFVEPVDGAIYPAYRGVSTRSNGEERRADSKRELRTNVLNAVSPWRTLCVAAAGAGCSSEHCGSTATQTPLYLRGHFCPAALAVSRLIQFRPAQNGNWFPEAWRLESLRFNFHDRHPVPKIVVEMRLLIILPPCTYRPLCRLQLITEPMCLNQMIDNFVERVYHVEQGGIVLFVYHLRLIVQNCYTFNGVSAKQAALSKRGGAG